MKERIARIILHRIDICGYIYPLNRKVLPSRLPLGPAIIQATVYSGNT